MHARSTAPLALCFGGSLQMCFAVENACGALSGRFPWLAADAQGLIQRQLFEVLLHRICNAAVVTSTAVWQTCCHVPGTVSTRLSAPAGLLEL